MNINIWGVADDIERLVQSPHPADTDDLADPGIPLPNLLQRPAGPVLLRFVTPPSNGQALGSALGSRSRGVDLLYWCRPDMETGFVWKP
jgi:hypothetical protein